VLGTPRLTDARILVVDDERANVVLLERLLARDGYRNVRASPTHRR
jgi:CheY-like chemotaxis protein